jgi:hypothetical protein
VWIYTQSNITQASYSPEYITPTQQISRYSLIHCMLAIYLENTSPLKTQLRSNWLPKDTISWQPASERRYILTAQELPLWLCYNFVRILCTWYYILFLNYTWC